MTPTQTPSAAALNTPSQSPASAPGAVDEDSNDQAVIEAAVRAFIAQKEAIAAEAVPHSALKTFVAHDPAYLPLLSALHVAASTRQAQDGTGVTERDQFHALLVNFEQMASGIGSDLSTAHSMRGPGASSEMRSDDRDQRERFNKLVTDVRAALEAARVQPATPAPARVPDDLVALSEKATQGEWWHQSDLGLKDHRTIWAGTPWLNGKVQTFVADCLWEHGDSGETNAVDDAELIVVLVNDLRERIARQRTREMENAPIPPTTSGSAA